MNPLSKGLFGAVFLTLAVGVSGTASAQSGEKLCKVTVDRSQPGGVFDVTKVVADDGDCVCYTYTGPASQGKDVEDRVSALLQSRSCEGAKVVNVPKTAGAGVSGGWAAAGAAAAFGAFLKVASDRADDDQPFSP